MEHFGYSKRNKTELTTILHHSNPKEKGSHHSPNLKIYLGLINPRSTLKFDLFLVEWTSCQGCAWKWIDFDLLLLVGKTPRHINKKRLSGKSL